MSFSFEALVMVAAIALCIGGLVGAIISRTLIPPEVQKDLESKLQASRNELEQYQQDVAQHFADTSKLVGSLTKSYKDVHDHLSKGAIQLTNAEISKQILEAGGSQLGHDDKNTLDELSFEPPKDWAPKTPGQKGVLSEEFGLGDAPEDDGLEVATANNKAKDV